MSGSRDLALEAFQGMTRKELVYFIADLELLIESKASAEQDLEVALCADTAIAPSSI